MGVTVRKAGSQDETVFRGEVDRVAGPTCWGWIESSAVRIWDNSDGRTVPPILGI